METKLKITLKVCGVEFYATAENIAAAYRYVEAIINSHPVEFPNSDLTLSEYMSILAEFRDAGKISCENHIFRIEVA